MLHTGGVQVIVKNRTGTVPVQLSAMSQLTTHKN